GAIVWLGPSLQRPSNVKPAARSAGDGSSAPSLKVRAKPGTPNVSPITDALGGTFLMSILLVTTGEYQPRSSLTRSPTVLLLGPSPFVASNSGDGPVAYTSNVPPS